MKTITLAKRWFDQVDPVTREEYPAGWSGEVTDDRAERAAAAGVLVADDVEPVRAPLAPNKPQAIRPRKLKASD